MRLPGDPASILREAKAFLRHPVKRILAVSFGVVLIILAVQGDLTISELAVPNIIAIFVILLVAEVLNVVLRRSRQ